MSSPVKIVYGDDAIEHADIAVKVYRHMTKAHAIPARKTVIVHIVKTGFGIGRRPEGEQHDFTAVLHQRRQTIIVRAQFKRW